MANRRLIGYRLFRQYESIENLISTSSLSRTVKAGEGQSANIMTVAGGKGLPSCRDVIQPGYRHTAALTVLLGQKNSGLDAIQQTRNFSIFPWSKSKKDDSKDESSIDGQQPIEGDFAASLPESESSADSLVQLTDIAESAALADAMEGAWLPTRTLQWALESVHNVSGLPWWQSIMLTTLGIRAAMLPINIMQIKNTYRLSQARPEIEHLIAHMKEEQARGNPNATAEYQQQVMRVWTKYNANPLKSMATIFVQAPLFIGFFSALRGLAAAKVPSLVEGGTLWFHDLTVADPTYALPIIASGSFLLMIELNAADGMQGQPEKMRSRFKNIMRGVAVLIVPFTIDLPAAVFMYWSASNLVSLVQSSLLKRPSIKKAFGIPTLTTSGAPESPLIQEPGKPIETFSAKPRKKSKKQAKAGKSA